MQIPPSDKLEITFTRDNNLIYFPGEEVTGNLIIKERLNIYSVLLEIKGETYIYWLANDDAGTKHTQNQTLFEDKQFQKHIFLNEQENSFPFKFTLPANNLPTSYEFLENYIRYWVKATIEGPLSLKEQALRIFTVINPLDLNILPGIRQPFGVNDIKTVCCGPCKSDPIIIDLQTNKTGFVAGETIVFNALIDNRSSKKIRSVSAFLIQNIELNDGYSIAPYKINIVTLPYTGPKIDPVMKVYWSNMRLTIPPVCPSFQDTCEIIKLHYTLTLVVDVSTHSVNKVVDLPIVIGTVPLNDSNINLRAIKYCLSIIDRHGGNKYMYPEKMELEALRKALRRGRKHDLLYFEPRYPYYGNSPLDND